MKSYKKITALVFTFAMALALVACGGNASGSANTPASNTSANVSESDSSATKVELAGKPWVTSIIQGNLPKEPPAAKDDIYTHYNYEYLASHQDQPSAAMQDYATELQAANLTIIKDASKSSHDLDQLRIFFDQAADTETLHKIGLADVQPYLDRIDAVATIDEMNALLTANDFPFSPFVLSSLTLADTRDVNIVNVSANLALVDTISVGGSYYQDSDDPQTQQSMLAAVQNSSTLALYDLLVAGMSQEEVKDKFDAIYEFEKAHGKHVDFNGKYSLQDFGAMAEAAKNRYFTLDELCTACPKFPMKETLAKMGKDASPKYIATREWLEAFNGVWTNENIEAIKTIAKMQVLSETRPYRDPSALNQMLEAYGQSAADADSFAYEACNQQSTFAIVLARSYVDTVLGSNAKTRLTKLCQELVDVYKDLIGGTQWIGDKSKQRVVEKLDHMTLNVLEPTGGYYDFGKVELTPSNQGGTLIGNYLKLKQYRLDQESKMVGKPAVAACLWFTIKPTEANAFYDPTSNSINIYPGYVSSLIYTENMSDLELLGGAGFTIGHEISHSFDYQGAQVDAYGTPNPVFADADVDAFVLKCSTLALYYNRIEVAPDTMANGQNIITEAAADLCAMQAIIELANRDENADYEQLFARVSNVWAQVTPEAILPNLLLDVHPLNNLRINVNAQMFDAIYDKLGVVEGDAMFLAPDERINIWGANA